MCDPISAINIPETGSYVVPATGVNVAVATVNVGAVPASKLAHRVEILPIADSVAISCVESPSCVRKSVYPNS